jgi:NADPH2:quinone reductase
VWVGAFSKRDPAQHRANAREIWKLYAQGKIKPHVWGTFPLVKAADALNALSARKVAGKVVLTMEG